MGRTRILWAQVLGLAAVQGAISLTWVIYNLYLPDLLSGLGFAAGMAAILLIIENILAAVMEPFMGTLSDQSQRWVGSRFPQIALGLILASICFIGIPIIVIFGGQALRLALPVALVAWALAMTVFRSPALSLLGRYAFDSDLPQAASVLTLVGGVTGAMAPLAGSFILSLGPGVAFTIGSLVLLGAAAVLRQVNPKKSIQGSSTVATGNISAAEGKAQSVALMNLLPRLLPNLALIFTTGMGVAMGFRSLLQTFPQLLKTQVNAIQAGSVPAAWIMALIFLSIAFTALPCGTLASRWGNRRAMGSGLVAMGLVCLLLMTTHSVLQAVGFAIATGTAFSLVSNGTLPYALSMVPRDKSGLGTGIYFSGGAVAMSLFGSFSQRIGTPSNSAMLALGAGCFVLAALCVFISRRWQGEQPA